MRISRKSKKIDNNMINWLEMTREERNAHDHDQKRNTMKRKQVLLKKIRTEYKNLSKTTKK